MQPDDIEVSDKGGVFDKVHVDNTLLEKTFEDLFVETYGKDALGFLQECYTVAEQWQERICGEARKRGVNTSGRIMIGMKGRIGMQKITKEDWDCIFNTESPDFEKKFNALVSKYIEKREAEIPNMDKSEQIGYRKGLDFLLWMTFLRFL